MGADSLAENTPNAPEFICPSPKVLNFQEKRLHWASVIRALNHNDMKEYTIKSQITNTVIEIRETFYDNKIKKIRMIQEVTGLSNVILDYPRSARPLLNCAV